jgi:hypothetical protein
MHIVDAKPLSSYIRCTGEDLPEIRDWAWPAA